MGHSVRSCMLGMRIAQHIGMPISERGDLFYAVLLKDAGCSSNSSKLFHIVAGEEIITKRDGKVTHWSRVGWESLEYALTHVGTGAPFLQRIRTLFRAVANHRQESCTLIKIRCER